MTEAKMTAWIPPTDDDVEANARFIERVVALYRAHGSGPLTTRTITEAIIAEEGFSPDEPSLYWSGVLNTILRVADIIGESERERTEMHLREMDDEIAEGSCPTTKASEMLFWAVRKPS